MCPACGQEPGVKSRSGQGSEQQAPHSQPVGADSSPASSGKAPRCAGAVDATSENTRERRTKGGGSSEMRSVPPVPPTPEVCKGSPPTGSPRPRILPLPSHPPSSSPRPPPPSLNLLPPSRRRRSQAPAPSSSAAPSSRPQQRKVPGAEPAGASESASLRLTLRTSGYGGWVPPPPHRGSKIIRDGRGPEREAGCPGAQCPAVSTPALPPGSGFESLVPRVKIREKEGGLNLGPGCSQGPSPAPGAVTGNHQVPADKEPVVQSSAPAAGVSSLPHLGEQGCVGPGRVRLSGVLFRSCLFKSGEVSKGKLRALRRARPAGLGREEGAPSAWLRGSPAPTPTPQYPRPGTCAGARAAPRGAGGSGSAGWGRRGPGSAGAGPRERGRAALTRRSRWPPGLAAAAAAAGSGPETRARARARARPSGAGAGSRRASGALPGPGAPARLCCSRHGGGGRRSPHSSRSARSSAARTSPAARRSRRPAALGRELVGVAPAGPAAGGDPPHQPTETPA
ncbi:unnamed protein product [Rangifer tarandus platyrhynchus]|uniref:Uncharacterized protein n=1 Tax=Rangifer tarandus platyrhynchus TaxID=3082113 RepID=A0AC59ZSY0_RANTA